MKVKFCKECMWSKPDKTSSWALRCFNPQVNASDHWALGDAQMNGTCCSREREMKWFAACGMKGKQWELLK